jgi:hypothetical protein
MALGPGKYDDELTRALASCRRKDPRLFGGLLIVIGPPGSNGFSGQLPLREIMDVPRLLRHVADSLEADLKEGKI